ncbi:hypothetical protein SAMN05421774_10748 [Gemmobacter megaterium]|uniref:Uncharacterized protein n=1 Tax=Gemmobacter megaterium TaxID=1086013 RepID=A0A1N7Q3K3_9RHOB|nr:hypothetical protein SAMN05421774_10748 [Gemmobacter megaterium]
MSEPPRKRRSDAAMSGMVATAVLVVIAVLTFVFVWVGG